MGIKRIIFENVKSLKNTYLNLSELNVLIGRNGAGKSNIEKYINYFYNNLLSSSISRDIFDKKNPYNDRVKIAIHYDLSEFLSIRSNREKEMFSKIKTVVNEKNEIVLEFIQYKDNRVEWNYPYEVRKIIKYLYPIYFIDTRNLDVLDWNVVWDIIGDLGQYRSEVEDDLIDNLDGIMEEIYGDKHKESYDLLKNDFEENGYGFKSYKNSDIFKQLYKLRFKGEQFIYKNNTLDFYSIGSNSYNYLKLFYQVLKKLHMNKLKAPIIILDEPEIGLHPNLIDEFIKFILFENGRIQTLLSTHSPRIIKNAMVLDDTNIFQITQKNYQTIVKKVKNVDERKLKEVISDKEASYYFSKGIIFVEGISEYELLTHSVLKQRFPVLNKVDIYSYNSNNIALDISHPTQRKLNTPYLLILDLDKILTYNKEEGKFDITGDSYNPLKNEEIINKENYYFGSKREIQIIRKRINGIVEKVKFTYNPFSFHFNDELFDEFTDLIKEYCKYYNVYPVSTTVEGIIVNKNNYIYFYKWLTRNNSTYMGKEELIELWSLTENEQYRLNILRNIIDGKLEPLFGLKKKKLMNDVPDSIFKDGYTRALKLPRLDKGSGWVTNYVNDLYKMLKKKEKTALFDRLFPELVDIIETMEIIKE